MKADALDAGVAVSVTDVPLSKFAVQVAPQLMPAGELETVPEPAPAVLTANAYWITAGAKVAVTDWFEFSVTLQLAVPEQAPLHPVKTDPAAGVAARLTTVPEV